MQVIAFTLNKVEKSAGELPPKICVILQYLRENSHRTLPPNTPTEHSHRTLPPNTSTEHSHRTLPPKICVNLQYLREHFHRTLPPNTPTEHSHRTLPPKICVNLQYLRENFHRTLPTCYLRKSTRGLSTPYTTTHSLS